MNDALRETLLTRYPVLGKLRPERLSRIVDTLQPMLVASDTILLDAHQPCLGLPLVFEGAIRIVKEEAAGRQLLLYRVFPGEICILTTSCLLGQADFNARAISEGPVTLAVLPYALFDELLAEPVFRNFVFSLFSERLADLMQLVEEVAFRKLDQRLAMVLLGKGTMIRVTHQELADELGCSREVVSRLLKRFSDQGMVRLGRERIELADRGALHRLARQTPVGAV